jgi:putative nucleotidyltransferase with HDIG domain
MTAQPALLAYPGALTGSRLGALPLAGDLTALALALGSQDPYTQGHSRRVAEYAARMAARLDMGPEERALVHNGGLLHDIGKIGFSRRLRANRNTRLTPRMRAEIRQHPEIGFNFLKALGVCDPVVDCVRYHHERPDGSGYPYGLKVEEIPRKAQIISVADCFDALTTDRPYQKGRKLGHAIAIMERMGPGIFPPDLLRVLIEEVRDNGAPITDHDAVPETGARLYSFRIPG